MPLARYFCLVGAALLALLFVSDAVLPKLPTNAALVSAIDLPVIRIRSDRKWPEPVVFDTSLPSIAPAPATKVVASVPATAADVPAKARVREAFAQFTSDPGRIDPSVASKQEAKLQPKRKFAKNPAIAKNPVNTKNSFGPPMLLVAQQPRIGLFANNIW